MVDRSRTVLPCISGEYPSNVILEPMRISALESRALLISRKLDSPLTGQFSVKDQDAFPACFEIKAAVASWEIDGLLRRQT